jgi:hypothetical protein
VRRLYGSAPDRLVTAAPDLATAERFMKSRD